MSRKTSYERLFERPKPKDDIKIVGQNINKYINQLENYIKAYPKPKRDITPGQEDVELEIVKQEELKHNKIDLILEANKFLNNNQSNETYSALISDTTRKTPTETFRSKNVINKTNKRRKRSSPFGNRNNEYQNKQMLEKDASKLLISNIKSMCKLKSETINSRDSDHKFRSKESNEYSYGGDVRKMEPKIPHGDTVNIDSPLNGRNIDKNNPNSFLMSLNKEKKHTKNNSNVSNNNKVLYSRAKNVAPVGDPNKTGRQTIRSRRIISPSKHAAKESLNLTIRPKTHERRIKLSSNRHMFKNQYIKSSKILKPKQAANTYKRDSNRMSSVKIRNNNRYC